MEVYREKMLGENFFKRRVRDDELTMEILDLIRIIRKEKETPTLNAILRLKMKTEYDALNNMRGRLWSRIRKLERQGRIEKVKTEQGVVLRIRRT